MSAWKSPAACGPAAALIECVDSLWPRFKFPAAAAEGVIRGMRNPDIEALCEAVKRWHAKNLDSVGPIWTGAESVQQELGRTVGVGWTAEHADLRSWLGRGARHGDDVAKELLEADNAAASTGGILADLKAWSNMLRESRSYSYYHRRKPWPAREEDVPYRARVLMVRSIERCLEQLRTFGVATERQVADWERMVGEELELAGERRGEPPPAAPSLADFDVDRKPAAAPPDVLTGDDIPF